ncbi:protein S100-A1-like [Engystomops pustulosus]|uniref:protein S100-A1-like n=1 Tax=Engystomops pustulosus TaxID=76066 RepID=UPI003AFABE1D
MANLLCAIRRIIDTFHSYSIRSGPCDKLDKAQFQSLIQTQFAEVIEDSGDPHTIEAILRAPAENNDGEIDFKEFLELVSKVAVAYFEAPRSKKGQISASQKGSLLHPSTSSKTCELTPKQD